MGESARPWLWQKCESLLLSLITLHPVMSPLLFASPARPTLSFNSVEKAQLWIHWPSQFWKLFPSHCDLNGEKSVGEVVSTSTRNVSIYPLLFFSAHTSSFIFKIWSKYSLQMPAYEQRLIMHGKIGPIIIIMLKDAGEISLFLPCKLYI